MAKNPLESDPGLAQKEKQSRAMKQRTSDGFMARRLPVKDGSSPKESARMTSSTTKRGEKRIGGNNASI